MATLRELREGTVLTQAELAKLAGVTPATVSDLEIGKRKPRPSTVRKLAKALRVKAPEIEFAYPDAERPSSSVKSRVQQ